MLNQEHIVLNISNFKIVKIAGKDRKRYKNNKKVIGLTPSPQ